MIREHGWTVCEHGWTIRENGWTIRENGWTIRENGWTIRENGRTIRENGRTIDSGCPRFSRLNRRGYYWHRFRRRGLLCWGRLGRWHGSLNRFKSLSRNIQNDDHAHNRQRQQRPHIFTFHKFLRFAVRVQTPPSVLLHLAFRLTNYGPDRSFAMGCNPTAVRGPAQPGLIKLV